MAFDLAAWAVLFVVASVVGRGALALLGASDLRPGDRVILGAWIGLALFAVALLTASLRSPLTPIATLGTTLVVVALGVMVARARRVTPVHRPSTPRWSIAAGAVAVALGASALASDPVTLYDSLVYHLSVIRWAREVGTVPGVALIHNRLGHVSAWFALAAAFEVGGAIGRAANVPFGFALTLVGLQVSLAAARIAARRAVVADWFLGLASIALIWPVAIRDVASPSPDVVTNVLIVVAAWSVLVVAPDATSFRRRLVPFVLALGACAMKLFALPAMLSTGIYALVAAPERPLAAVVRRAVLCLCVAAAIAGPYMVANLTASGCPAYPSSIGCLDAAWSVGNARAAEYATYVRDVARWERRGETSVGASFGWVVPWVLAHPLIAFLAVLSVGLGVMQLARVTAAHAGRQRLDGVRAVVAFAILGVGFAAWLAPAPRFLYAFVTIVPALALSVSLQSRTSPVSPITTRSRSGGLAFVMTSVGVGLVYAVASQKVNVRSALTNHAPLVSLTAADLLIPAAPEAPARLFRWRVNDVDLLTPVPRPIADTLGYRSVIGWNTALEKCSTAPLPCTPYLPDQNIRLRRPASGLAGGFVRAQEPSLAGRVARCVGELTRTADGRPMSLRTPESAELAGRCGDGAAR